MVYYHDRAGDMDFSRYISRHSGDKILEYKQVNGEPVNLALYFPKDYSCENSYPVFVCVHGGGWHSHKIFQDQKAWAGDYLGYLCRYYSEKGFIAVSIDYRLLREKGQAEGFQIIDLYQDCADAVEYLQIHSKEYGMDFERSVVLGESAGGQLAGALTTFTYYRAPAFKAAILVNPITDFVDSRWRNFVPVKSEHPKLKDLCLAERVEFLSPAQRVTKETCPVLLIHGTDDNVVHPRHSQDFYDETRLHDTKADLHWIKDTNHAFLLCEYEIEKNGSTGPAATSIEIINNWLEKNNKFII